MNKKLLTRIDSILKEIEETEKECGMVPHCSGCKWNRKIAKLLTAVKAQD